MTLERIQRLRQVLKQRQPDLAVLTDHVHKGRNLAAIVRNCDAVGIGSMHCVMPDKEYRQYKGTARGSQRWVRIERHLTLDAAFHVLKQQGMQIVAAHPGEGVKNYYEVDYTRPTAIVMGAKKHGLSQQSRQYCDQFIRVPMSGMVESLNVAVASGIVLAEAQRQRTQAGYYDRCRLSAAEFERLFFEWGHAKVHAFCQRYQLAYPPLDEHGEIVEPARWYRQACAEISQQKAARKRLNNN